MKPSLRQCSFCKDHKVLTDFPLSSKMKNGERRRRTYCTKCLYLKTRLSRWGLTFDELMVMWAEQDHCCKLCCKEGNPIAHPRATLVIDHDHETGQIRGLLCDKCNQWVGFLEKMSLEWLEKASEYIE